MWLKLNQKTNRVWAGTVAVGMLCAVMGACQSTGSKEAAAPLKPPTPAETRPGFGQETFDTPDAAVVALLEAVRSDDHSGLQKIFGPEGKELVSGDPVQDAASYKSFADETSERAQIEERSGNMAILHIGNEDWPFPIPIAKDANGKWYFDTAEGKKESLARRNGATELETISVARAYEHAQRDYASVDRDGDEVLQYAQRFRSSPGKEDGLYWEAAAGEAESPFGPLVAQATSEGYGRNKPDTGRHPFHGYYYRILTAQGPAAAGRGIQLCDQWEDDRGVRIDFVAG